MRTPRFIRYLPLLSGIAETRKVDHKSAAGELSSVIVFSMVPIILGTIFVLSDMQNHFSITEAFLHTVSRGEVLIYAITMISPMFYFINKTYPSAPSFPSKIVFMVAAAMILAISYCLFGFIRYRVVFGDTSPFNEELVLWVSLVCYLLAVALVYLAYVYRSLLETGAPSISSQDTAGFVEAWNNR